MVLGMSFTHAFFTSFFALTVFGCGSAVETGSTGSGGSGGSGGGEPHCETCAPPWVLALGGKDWSTVRDVVTDASGNIVFLANLFGAVDGLGLEVSNGGRTFIVKLDPAGEVLWTRELPVAGVARLAVDAAGHVFLAGASDNVVVDLGGGPLGPAQNETLVFLAELDDTGNHVWSRAVATPPASEDGNGYVLPLEIAVGPTGNLVVSGTFSGSLDFGDGELDLPENPLAGKVFVATFDGTGHLLWSERFGSQPDGNEMFTDTGLFLDDLAVAADGTIWLSAEVWGALHVGDDVFTSAGKSDGLIASLDAEGHPLLTRLFGGIGTDAVTAMDLAPDGNVALTGFATGTVDFGQGPTVGDPMIASPFIASLNANGATRWATRLPPQGPDANYGIRVGITPEGDVVTLLEEIGASVSVVTLGGAAGTALHFASFASTSSDGFDSLLSFDAFTLDADGNALVGGALRGSLDLGPGPITLEPPSWGTGAFIARMAR